MLTCDPDFGVDATELFNYLTTGFTPKRSYRKLLVAPKDLKKELLSKIEREVKTHSKKRPGRILFKMNALEDADVCRALYEASMAGVEVNLIVRDSCRIRPGIPGLSEQIRVISIVGRFLEHTRIFYFRNGGAEEYFIGSADVMRRNLEHRVEVVAPVEAPALRAELRAMLDAQWNDQRSAWEMQQDGSYRQLSGKGKKESRSSQETLILRAEKRKKEAGRLKKRKSKSVGGRNIR
jgi:polyphosphate kinase